MSLDWDHGYLGDLAASDPGAIHVLIRDQAGVASLRSPLRGSLRQAVSLRSAHLREGDPRLPARVRIIDLPPSTPELNPCEQLMAGAAATLRAAFGSLSRSARFWDILKDDLANRIHASVAGLRAGLKATLRRFWEDPGAVLRLIGRQWLQDQLNASHNPQVSC